MRQALEVLTFKQAWNTTEMPKVSDIMRCSINGAVNTVKQEILPPILDELKKENAELKERVKKLEELVNALILTKTPQST